ncbi:TBC domain-containing protein kinase-like protein [Orchesella cincta]|uniref:TBC domain-containing protein kinase-like protein n=1 Tax=Orchesella cincta TaxID=48709 RepID=A0A1D2MZE6_ORCCI|nr:TBC domain-containing protein kinase-like protein [Orchesella cincta]
MALPWEDRRLGNAQFGVVFFTSSQRQDTCGTNGLPLTPNSIRILGKSQYLKSLSHPNLVQYIDVIRAKHERIVVVSEFHSNNLRKLIKSGEIELGTINASSEILKIAKQILSGLEHLNKHGITSRNLQLENIMLDEDGNVKMFNYGMYYMTNCGKFVTFPIGSPKYFAPEIFHHSTKKGQLMHYCDTWSLGLILVELVLGKELWVDLKLSEIITKIKGFQRCSNVFQSILEEEGQLDIVQKLSPAIRTLIEKCLIVNPSARPWPKQLLKDMRIFSQDLQVDTCKVVSDSQEIQLDNGVASESYAQLCRSSTLPFTTNFSQSCSVDESQDNQQLNGDDQNKCFPYHSLEQYAEMPLSMDTSDLLKFRSLKEVYYLWQLAGGDVIAELKRQGLTRKKPAVLSLPNSMTLEGESSGKSKERGLLLDQTVIILPLNELRKRLNDIPAEDYYPLLEFPQYHPRSENGIFVEETSTLPLIIREKDIEYQFHRIVLFDRLLGSYPFTKSSIYKEAMLDIPPFFRAKIWSCLLGIDGDIEHNYYSIDKETPTSTDRQIEVDIPRCHQYDELLSSSTGHQKFKRVLKAWVVSNTEYVYWQGLDSLCAPFLYLNFNNEAMAFSCLSAFIPKYLYNFFLKDNSVIIQEFLAKFSQLIAFHDPQLTNHLDSIGFIPELYAIPWFLTMFSHVFPLHKIFHLWDKLLLSDSSFSLCIGLSILFQLRESLLNSGFNECILLFSDMPEINIERCVKDSVEVYCNTPRSALCRKFDPPCTTHCSDLGRQVTLYDSDTHFRPTEKPPLKTSPSTDALKTEAISLAELKCEKCTRISGEDFLELLDLTRSKFQKPKMIVIDVRNHEDYNRGTIPGSINMPYITSFAQDDSLVPCSELSILNSNIGKIIVVVGNRGDSAVKFAEKILRLDYPKICVLHRGIDIFRSSDILVVPTSV